MAQTVFPRPNDASKVNVSDFYASNLPMSTTDSTTAGSKIGTLEGKLYTVLTSGSLKTFAINTSEGFTCFRYNNSVTDTPCQFGHGYVVHYGQNIRIVVFDMLTISEYSIYSQNTGSSWSSWEELALDSDLKKHTIVDRYNATSFTAMKDYLITVNSGLENGELVPVRIVANFGNTDVIQGYYEYSGTLMKMNGAYFQARLTADNGLSILFAYSNGTWTIDSIAFNSKFVDLGIITASTINEFFASACVAFNSKNISGVACPTIVAWSGHNNFVGVMQAATNWVKFNMSTHDDFVYGNYSKTSSAIDYLTTFNTTLNTKLSYLEKTTATSAADITFTYSQDRYVAQLFVQQNSGAHGIFAIGFKKNTANGFITKLAGASDCPTPTVDSNGLITISVGNWSKVTLISPEISYFS